MRQGAVLAVAALAAASFAIPASAESMSIDTMSVIYETIPADSADYSGGIVYESVVPGDGASLEMLTDTGSMTYESAAVEYTGDAGVVVYEAAPVEEIYAMDAPMMTGDAGIVYLESSEPVEYTQSYDASGIAIEDAGEISIVYDDAPVTTVVTY